ncbi:MAG: heme o synthase [Candidatus Doudnabacteria bacterium]
MIKNYYRLAKPGIIYGNALTALAGFLLASEGRYNIILLSGMLLGLSLIIGAGCVFNNFIDSDIDDKMQRTKHRALVTGDISPRNALIFGNILGFFGVIVLGLFTNLLTLGIALLGFFFYVFVYTFAKRRTDYGTILGTISGAMPPLVGYTAVSGRIDSGAIILFVIMVLWQMPHFFGMALYRLEDYKNAGIPVLPVTKGIYRTKIHIILYIALLIPALLALRYYGYVGNIYVVVMGLFTVIWLGIALSGFRKGLHDGLWGRKIFLFSLIFIMVWSVMLSVDSLLF